ncbi:MAG: hypothetical protein CFE42_13470 [Ralstonia sp. PBBBR1]|jgi:hypothetical protein|nr:MAG: hypothetical protein CFE42_13470 [Ralstonia sp. PBBBR1]
MKERLLEGNLSEGRFDFRLLFSSGIFLWSTPLSFPAGTDSLFFVLPKKSKQKKGAIKGSTSKEKGQPVARLALSFGLAPRGCGFCLLTFLP